ncbi:MAG: hypothetical protein JNG89_05155 [Planctomycetaceae bacterium]|nr:hypothetical protein [Planctomycetaceae bacterium]
MLVIVVISGELASAAPPAPPGDVAAGDHDGDDGLKIDVGFVRSQDDAPFAATPMVKEYLIRRATEPDGLFVEVRRVKTGEADKESEIIDAEIELTAAERGEQFWFRVSAVGLDGEVSAYVQTTTPVASTRELFDRARGWLAVLMIALCGAIVAFIALARRGAKLYVRPIAGLEAVEEAVGRATEMGRPCLFVPGIQDMNEIQTIAGLAVLSRVAERAAEYDATVEVPTSKSLVMTAARETVEAAYYTAGRPDAFNADRVYYVTDEQFGYVAYLTGHMVREKPAACFYMGSFFAESLMLAETGNSVGAIQVAGTAQPSQLPFFVAACDYTLIGEEFFAASAYLSGDPDQLGSLKGQDVGKLIVAALLLVGCGLFTLGTAGGSSVAEHAATYLKTVILSGG